MFDMSSKYKYLKKASFFKLNKRALEIVYGMEGVPIQKSSFSNCILTHFQSRTDDLFDGNFSSNTCQMIFIYRQTQVFIVIHPLKNV